ncbi:dihydrofolate reductase family protein [Solirubrobacter soli]|uniref:dihydrofolate reductase family protein n=1 Tax=Solirubrobacter soli TaxID=363832 RepID=UPI0003F618EE|nr:dihydrofolate reductase family protein [Solirubrobacter soli]
MFRRLIDGGEVGALEALGDLGARATDERPHVFFNFVTTLDGRAALDGTTRPLGGEGDLELLLSLRTVADAVLVGPGTIRAEGYGRLIGPDRRPEPPPVVLISRRFDLPWAAPLFEAADQPVIVYTQSDGPVPEVAAPVEVVRLADARPAAVLADLRARGVRALLSEGGPTLFHALLQDGLVDELFLTVSPLLTGDQAETGILSGARLPEPARMQLSGALRAGDELFLRYATLR